MFRLKIQVFLGDFSVFLPKICRNLPPPPPLHPTLLPHPWGSKGVDCSGVMCKKRISTSSN